MVKWIEEHDTMLLSVEFDDGTGYKRRPAIAIKVTGREIVFYRITSQYENKSDYIRSKYFEIIDYTDAGLRKKSWIDTLKAHSVYENEITIKVIGHLSARDTERMLDFMSE